MGDILWAHLEILQKDCGGSSSNSGSDSANSSGSSSNRPSPSSNIENIPSNFSDNFSPAPVVPTSSAAPTTNGGDSGYGRTYTQLEPNPSANKAADALYNGSNMAPQQQQQQQQQRLYPEYQGSTGPGSTVDSSSEYSYHGGQQQQHILGGRVPQYPPVYDQFSDWGSCNGGAAIGNGYQLESWHQPAEYHQAAAAAAAAAASSSVVTSSTTNVATSCAGQQPPNGLGIQGMHHHPAFLQVFFFPYILAKKKCSHSSRSSSSFLLRLSFLR